MDDNNCTYQNENFPAANDSDICLGLLSNFSDLTGNLQIYDLYKRCYGPGPLPHHLGDPIGSVEIGDEIKTYRRHYTTRDYTPWAFTGKASRTGKLSDVNPLGPCTFGQPFIDFINNPKVRELLHIPTKVQAWEMCTD
jgi:hypothetical protein